MNPHSINPQDYAFHHFKLTYNTEIPCIEMTVAGFMEGDDFRKNTLQMLELMKEFKVNKVLIDASNMQIITHEDRQWLEREFLPKAVLMGFKACSFVKPSNIHARVALEVVMYHIPEDWVQIGWFDAVQDAKKWLRETHTLFLCEN